MRTLLYYWPVLFVLVFAVMLTIIVIGLYRKAQRDSYVERVFGLDKYMVSDAKPVSEEEMVRVMRKYNFQYRGYQNQKSREIVDSIRINDNNQTEPTFNRDIQPDFSGYLD